MDDHSEMNGNSQAEDHGQSNGGDQDRDMDQDSGGDWKRETDDWFIFVILYIVCLCPLDSYVKMCKETLICQKQSDRLLGIQIFMF